MVIILTKISVYLFHTKNAVCLPKNDRHLQGGILRLINLANYEEVSSLLHQAA